MVTDQASCLLTMVAQKKAVRIKVRRHINWVKVKPRKTMELSARKNSIRNLTSE